MTILSLKWNSNTCKDALDIETRSKMCHHWTFFTKIFFPVIILFLKVVRYQTSASQPELTQTSNQQLSHIQMWVGANGINEYMLELMFC